MNNYFRKVINPQTGEIEDAEFLDNFYGLHEYGTNFSDGRVYRAHKIFPLEEKVVEGADKILKDFKDVLKRIAEYE